MSGVWAPAPACCQVQEERRCCVRVLRSLCGWVLGYLLFGGVRGGGPLRSVFSLPALSGGTHVRSPTSSSDSEEFYSVGSCGLDVCPMYSVPVRCGVSRCACLPRIFVPCWKRFYVVVRCGSWWRAGSSHLGAWVEMSLVPLPSPPPLFLCVAVLCRVPIRACVGSLGAGEGQAERKTAPTSSSSSSSSSSSAHPLSVQSPALQLSPSCGAVHAHYGAS